MQPKRQTHKQRRLSLLLVVSLLTMLMPFADIGSVTAAGAVGTGTPESCTEAALDAALAGGGLVTFNCGPNPVKITVTSTKEITADTTINGGDLVTLSGGDTVGVLLVDVDANLTIQNITISGGSSDSDGAIFNFFDGTLTVLNSTISGNSGGGILNAGTLTLINSTVSNNSTDFAGGGINNSADSTAEITDSTISNNTAGTDGGGIRNLGALTITNSTISGNHAEEAGGGIFSVDTLTIANTTISDNEAGSGGGIYHGGAIFEGGPDALFAVTFSTISGNSAQRGGGIFSLTGTYAIRNSTVSGNTALNQGGGIFNMGVTTTTAGGKAVIAASTITGNTAANGGSGIYHPALTLTISSTIVADNSGGSCFNDGTIVSTGFNLSDDDTCSFTEPTDLPDTPANLGPLADNGGSTLTHLPQAGSAAIDNGPDTCPSPDQRGVARPQGEACDIGSVEALQEDPPPAGESTTLCILGKAGLVRMPESGRCLRFETTLTLPEDGPLTLCVIRSAGLVRYNPDHGCRRFETAVVVTGNNSLDICVSRFIGLVRVPRQTGQCTRIGEPDVL